MRRAFAALLLVACSDGDSAGPPVAVKSQRASNVCGVLFEVQIRLGGRIHGATPDALSFKDYVLQADGTFASTGASCNDEVARRLTALCDVCQDAPAECEPQVRMLFHQVPAECSRCGDDVCFGGESAQSCPPDCAASCGDGTCSPLEYAAICPVDCAEACGDGMCAGGEDATSCPIDCRFTVGDGVCEPGETPENSPQDCGFSTCGDGFCQSYETALRCQEDCCWPRVCSDGYRRCRDSHTIEICEPSGAGACPELVAGEACPNGCVDDPAGLNTHCRSCDELIRDTFGEPRPGCDPRSAPRCSGNSRVYCRALASSPSCGYEVTEPCSGACAGGACVTCDADCALAYTRCGADMMSLEGCRLVAPGCQQWTRIQECSIGCSGSTNAERCTTCMDTGCGPGLACLAQTACATCAPGTCQQGTRRCAGRNVEACHAGELNGACTGWLVEQMCTGTCQTEKGSNAFCQN